MLMLDVLGWAFGRMGPKSDDFSSMVSALGVIFNLARTVDGTLLVTNTEKRIAEVVQCIENFYLWREKNFLDACDDLH